MRTGLLAAVMAGVLALSALVTPGLAQYPPYLLITHRTPMGQSPRGTVLMRVYLEAYETDPRDLKGLAAEGDLYRGSIESIYGQILFDGASVDPLGEPERVAAAAKPIPLVFLLAVDVSGSMGGVGGQGNFRTRLGPVCDALRSFVDEHAGSSEVYVRILPFGHEVPHAIPHLSGAMGERATLEYVPLTQHGASELRATISGIEEFGRTELIGGVDTALFATFVAGLRELSNLPPEVAGAKPVMVLLTDGANDFANHPDSPLSSVSVIDVLHALKSEDAPRVYTIGFDLPADALRQMTDIAVRAGEKVFFKEVTSGEAGARELAGTYKLILEFEGNQWYLEFDTGWTQDQVSVHGLPLIESWRGGGEVPPRVMTLVPSPDIAPSAGDRLPIFGVAVALLAALGLVRFLARPKAEDFVEAPDIGAEGELGAEETLGSVSMPGMTFPEWEAWKAQHQAGSDSQDET